jgi:hypothetical protein
LSARSGKQRALEQGTNRNGEESNCAQRAGFKGTKTIQESWTGTDGETKESTCNSKPLNLHGKFGNDSGDLCQIVQQNPDEKYVPCSPVQNFAPRDSRVCSMIQFEIKSPTITKNQDFIFSISLSVIRQPSRTGTVDDKALQGIRFISSH